MIGSCQVLSISVLASGQILPFRLVHRLFIDLTLLLLPFFLEVIVQAVHFLIKEKKLFDKWTKWLGLDFCLRATFQSTNSIWFEKLEFALEKIELNFAHAELFTVIFLPAYTGEERKTTHTNTQSKAINIAFVSVMLLFFVHKSILAALKRPEPFE